MKQRAEISGAGVAVSREKRIMKKHRQQHGGSIVVALARRSYAAAHEENMTATVAAKAK